MMLLIMLLLLLLLIMLMTDDVDYKQHIPIPALLHDKKKTSYQINNKSTETLKFHFREK